MLGRNVRAVFDLLRPKDQQNNFSGGKRCESFKERQIVMIRDY